MEEIKQALDLKAELDALRPIDKEQEGRIMQKFRLDWNYHSNHLEGNSLNYGETKALILFGVTAQGKPLKDHFEMTGHNEAINWVIEMVSGERPLTENFIRELHTLLLKESYEVDAITPDGKSTKKTIAVGSYKTTANHVKTKTGEIFYFATPEETPAEMNDLMVWYNKKSKETEVNPILLTAEFHYKFIRIHPFDDGNGRTARILMNFILMQFSFPPTIIKSDKESKDEYFAALQLADAGNIEAFITYIAQNLVRSLEIMIAGAKGEDIEEPDDLDKEIALLEQRLNNSEKIHKVKSIENINDIFENTIRKLAFELNDKLEVFRKHYVNYNINVGTRNVSNSIFNSNFHVNEIVGEIIMYVSFYTMKIKGFEDFSFHYTLKFQLEDLYYSVHEVNQSSSFYKKNYDNLNSSEIKKIIKVIVDNHNKQIESTLERKKS